jgi:uncharacterized protein YbjT (DUF2867 family)
MNSLTKAILVTGATGKQGGATIRNLASHPTASQFTLLAVTRNVNSTGAQSLITKYPSIKLVQGDLNAVPELFKSAQSVLESNNLPSKIWGVYSVQTSMGPGVSFDNEVAQGTALIDAALSHGVQHFVYSSVERGGNEKSWTNPTPIPHFQTKHQIELYLREKAGARGEKMGWTILRPVAFMDNMEPGFQTKVFLTALKNKMGDKPVQWVSVDDIGLFAARAFREPETWNARAEGLAGDELSVDGVSKAFQKTLGYPAPTTFGMLGTALLWAIKEMNVMITWFKTDGYAVDIPRLRREESSLCDFETWLAERSKFKAQ